MPKEAFIIYPNQLIKNIVKTIKNQKVYLVESNRFFSNFLFHKKKLILHRASMKAFYDYLESQNIEVEYLEMSKNNDCNFFKALKEDNIQLLHYIDPIDVKLEELLLKETQTLNISLKKHENPLFLNTQEEINDYFRESNKFSFTPFYIEQRKKLKILVNKQNKPLGGKWSFDKENRKKLPKDFKTPKINFSTNNKYITEAISYVEKKFFKNPGYSKDFAYPITHDEVLDFYNDFLEYRFYLFGDYEDAIVKNEPFLFHSIISYALNIGLITPKEVIDKTIDFYKDNKDKVPFNSLEGYIRQVIGWREYIRAVYTKKRNNEINSNYFGFNKKIPETFYNGETGITPVDTVIERLNKHAYAHHIERLMILGNFMMLCEFSPHEVYKWFMEMFIDAYDWVMVPNVYGMSQFADGGLIMTKPYISSSNYILKMSDFSAGDWTKTWDALYWSFLDKHRNKLSKNSRIKLMLNILDKKDKNIINEYKTQADTFFSEINT